jgi:hypothetical protein
MAGLDLYKTGEIAAWGSEKEYGTETEDESRQPAAVKRHDRDR